MMGYLDEIKRELPEEFEGVHEYMKLAHEARDSGHPEHAQILHDMAWEEYTHAKHLKCMLDGVHAEHPDYYEKMMKAEAELHNW